MMDDFDALPSQRIKKLTEEVSRLQDALADERDEKMWRFWSEKAGELATKNRELRATVEELNKALEAMTAVHFSATCGWYDDAAAAIRAMKELKG